MNNEKNPRLLLCPYCYKNIPIIKLLELKDTIDLRIKCSCSSIEKRMDLMAYLDKLDAAGYSKSKCKTHNISGLKYCIECVDWLCSICIHHHEINDLHLHSVLDNEVNLLCNRHLLSYSFYCKDCSFNLCEKCKCEHLNHNCIKLSQTDLSQLEENMKAIEIQINQNKCLYRKPYEYSCDINSLAFWQLNDIQNNIKLNSELENNNKINELLNKLYHCLYFTLRTFGKYICYQILMLAQTLKLNHNVLTYDSSLVQIQKTHIIIQEDQYCFIGKFSNKTSISCFLQLDNKRFASGSYDTNITIWSASTFSYINSWKAHTKAVYALCLFKGNGNDNKVQFASCSFDTRVKIWDAASYSCIKQLILNLVPMNMIQLNDNRLAIAFISNVIRIKSLEAKYKDNSDDTLYDTGYNVQCLIQLSNGYLASCSTQKDILIWNIWSMKYEYCLSGHKLEVNCLIELEDNILVSCSADNTIKIWDVVLACCNTTIDIQDDIPFSLIKLNRCQFASFSKEDIKIWNSITCKCESTLGLNNKMEACLLKLNNGDLISYTRNNNLIAWKKTKFNNH